MRAAGRRALPFVLMVSLLAGSAARSDDPTGRFELVAAERADSLAQKLKLAGNGYRILASAHTPTMTGKGQFVVLLERARSPDEGREHVVLSLAGDFDDDARGQVNARGAEGFRLRPEGIVARRVSDWWLPDDAYADQVVLILERPVSGSTVRYDYESVIVKGYEPLYRNLIDRRTEGFAVVGLLNTARRLRVLLERRVDGPPAAHPMGSVEPYRLLMRAKKRSLLTRLRMAGAEGYRVVLAVDQSINAPPMVLMEKHSGPTPSFEYAVIHEPLRRLRRGTLERKLNRKAARGFRLTRDGITARVMTLEPLPDGRTPPRYRTLTTRSPLGLPRAMDGATTRGYEFMAMFVDVDRTTVVLELAVDDPAVADATDRTATTAGAPRPGA
jgi:hypothetical protein